MKRFFMIFIAVLMVVAAVSSARAGYVPDSQTKKIQIKEEIAQVDDEGINFNEWESEFNTSMKKEKVDFKNCTAKSKNCQFEKFQALDPSFDMVH